MTSILLSSVQVTILGFQADGSWFKTVVSLMCEEETEDQEEKESMEQTHWLHQFQPDCETRLAEQVNRYWNLNPYLTFVGEVSSPPPESLT